MQKKVIITNNTHAYLIDYLTSKGYHVDYIPTITYKEFLSVVANYHGIVMNSKIKMNRAAFDKAKKLEFIARLGSGLDTIDLDYAKEVNVHVMSAPEGNRNAVAEHAMGMLLSLCNNLYKSNLEVKEFDWYREENRGFELSGKTVGIIGFGNNGAAFAKKLQGWDVEVLAYDEYKSGFADEFDWVTETTLEDLQEKSDVISLHIPLTKITKHLVDKNFIERCGKNFILINCARGKSVKTSDLIDGLTSGKVKGACLDVFENEKPNSFSTEEEKMYKTLLDFPNVLVSPHIAGWTTESFLKISRVLADKIDLIVA